MFQAQGLIYWTYRRTTFRALLQKLVQHQKQTRQQRTCKHFHESCNINDNLNVNIIQNNIITAATRRYHEDKWICKLKTLAPYGLNSKTGGYAKEIYNFY